MWQLDWTTFKSKIDSKGLFPQWISLPLQYDIRAIDGSFEFQCLLDKNPSDTTDLTDFETNYRDSTSANLRLSQKDTDGAVIVRNKAAKSGWTYAAIPLEFETARLSSSIVALLSDNSTTRPGMTLKAYNAAGTEVTTAGLLDANLATITKTIVDIELPYDYELIGGSLRTLTSIDTDMRLWIIAVPDIPAGSGGSKEMCGGLNLRYLAPGNEFRVDGRVSKYMTYNATYHTNKLRFILYYPAGTNESLSVSLEIYRA
jgi:hypothetical protein